MWPPTAAPLDESIVTACKGDNVHSRSTFKPFPPECEVPMMLLEVSIHLMVKLDIHVLPKATRVVVLQGFGISEGLREGLKHTQQISN